jgi:BirA family transcriptional regulator, biotin operon repressor / biotin---[acetyl-CoA-carboxylase] ligase
MIRSNVLADTLARNASEIAPFGAHVETHDAVGSTNDVAARLAHHGAPEGTLVVAGAQTHGRGRRGATWASPSGAGLYVSVVLRPKEWRGAALDRDRVHTLITLAAGVATVDALRECGAQHAVLKWPNDIVVHLPASTSEPVERRPARPDRGEPRPWRKLAGILAEGATTGSALQHVVVGIGVNLRRAPLDTALDGGVTTLADEAAVDPPADEEVLLSLLRALARERRRLADGDTAGIVRVWRERSPSSRDWPVSWEDGGRTRTGRTASIDDDGALLVDTEDGRARIMSGTVNW